MDLSKINSKSFFEKYIKLEEKISYDEYRAFCPFHNDTHTPNLSINTKKGVYFCFACNASGNIVDFYKAKTGRTARQFAEEFGIATIKSDKYVSYINKLKKSHIDYLKERGLTEETIKKYKIGSDDNRITIPVFDFYGMVINVRKYDKDSKKSKMMSFAKGMGSIQIFDIMNLKYDKIVFCEGEWDCILLNQHNIKSVTVTGGAGTFKNEWIEQYGIKGKEIYIIFDCDEAGKKGAEKVAHKLVKDNKVKIIDLGLKDKEDITDWFVKYGKTARQLVELIRSTDFCVQQELIDNYREVVLSTASYGENYNKPIMFKAIVAGKDLAPYQIPKMLELECKSAGKLDKCQSCSVASGYYKTEILEKEQMMGCIGVTTSQLDRVIRDICGIPKCNRYNIINELKRNIEETKLIPEIDFNAGNDEYEYVVRKAYYMGDNIKTNQTYLLMGTTLPDPTNQQVVHMIEEAFPIKDNIEEFKLTDDIKEQLKIFQSDDKSIDEKLKEIYNDFSNNVTKIYHREDLMLAYDLVYHSAIGLNFLGERLRKGWVELFVLGDSRTGKTKTIEHMVNHYKAGERISAENTTIAGLIAGLQQTQNRWTLMWGKIPLNDKRLLVVDEASGLRAEDYAQLSDVRSSGVAEVTKIQVQKTKARTRMIFISNPLRRRIIEFNYGVLAIKEIIGQNEDIARFDFAISVTDIDVEDSEINKRHVEETEHKYTSQVCHNLVMFAWSRKPENIIFTKDAEDAILAYANEFSNTFTRAIPLVQGAEIRIKLAKLSAALAIRLYNTDKDGENVIVEKRFVDYIRKYLLKIYSKSGFDYYEFSKQKQKEIKMSETDKIVEIIGNDKEVVDLLLSNNRHNLSDFELLFNADKKRAKEIVAILMRSMAIKKYYSWYVKTPAFIIFLKDYKEVLSGKEEV